MKKVFWALILIALCTVLAVLFSQRPKVPAVAQPAPRPESVQPARDPVNTPHALGQSVTPVLAAVLPSSNGPPLLVYSNALRNPDMFQRHVNAENLPVDFYGLVIDQDSNLLAGADVKIAVRHVSVSDPSALQVGSTEIRLEQMSGSDGRFEMHGATGDGFDVESITKDGYEPEPGQRSFGPASGSIAQPAVFKMWSTNIHEALIGGQKAFHIVPDGRPYFINLTDGTIADTGEGDLKVWVQYTNQIARGETYDWSAGITVPNGGLLEEPLGTAMYQAPADGYTPSFQLRQQIKGGQRGQTGDRQFYFMLKNGQEFGQMAIDLYAPFNNQVPGLVRISYAINPSGSRILR